MLSILFDLLILAGLASLGAGLFVLYGLGITLVYGGVASLVIGIWGHRARK